MSAEVIPFAFEDNLIRVVEIDGEPWFVGKDICAALAIADHHQALGRLDDDERGRYTVPTPSGSQDMTVVSEPGVYRLVFTSRRPEAERFKRWIAHEVLPSLRRRGFYALPTETEDVSGFGPIGVVNTKLAMIRECRLAFGASGARSLWRKLDLPIAEHEASQRHGSKSSAEELLGRLLDMVVDGGELVQPIHRQIDFALDGSTTTAAALAKIGILVEPGEEGGCLLHHGSGELLDLIQECGGGADWWRVLRSLPGNGPGPRARVDGQRARTTRIADRWIDRALTP